jgi:cell division protein ZipA
MGMRDWLIVIVIVGIVLILLDGYRRKRKDSIRVKLEKNIPDHDVELDTAAELPNGGARVVSRHGDSGESDENYDEDYQSYDEDDEEERVPVLMDAVDLDNVGAVESAEKKQNNLKSALNLNNENVSEPAYERDDIYADDSDEADSDEENEVADEEYVEVESDDFETAYTDDQEYDEITEDEISTVRTSQREVSPKAAENINSSRQDRIEPTLGEISFLSEAELEDKPSHIKSAQKKDKSNAQESGGQAELFAESPEDFIQDDEHDAGEDNYLEPEEVIVINVMAKQGELFAGRDLLPILLQQDMRLGKMSIFHKHADSSGNGPAIFSMANMVKPGTFDVTQMEEFTTPGVSFFLQLPNAFGNMKSFEQMLKAADAIKEKLNGELKDEHRSVITRQTIEHCRQRIQDFELAQLSKK